VSTVTPYGAADKHAAVQSMFGRIAGRYDLMNRLMTGGLDGAWRRATVAAAALPPGGAALDVGTGTGDLAIEWARTDPASRVVGIDYTGPMLALAPAKAARAKLADRTTFARADGHRLPFADASFDAVASAFVLRNFSDLGTAYADMARVVRPGGRVVALEICPPTSVVWRVAFQLYFNRIVPFIGQLVSGDGGAYRYLPASAAAFLTPAGMADVMRAAGLTPLPARVLMAGALAVHVGVKPGGYDAASV
jgi:demethylmenaquinone methyltransferase/2-methoxy-6-polyprenyl-1,4-benzoquinol methylase